MRGQSRSPPLFLVRSSLSLSLSDACCLSLPLFCFTIIVVNLILDTFPADDAKDGHGRREESIDAIEEIHAVFDRESTHHPGTTERRREREKERRITTRDNDDSDDDSDDERTTTTSEEEKRPTGRVEESGPFEQV